MKINFGACYYAMNLGEPDSGNCIGPFVRQRIDEYVKAYHKQLEPQIGESIKEWAVLPFDIHHKGKVDSPPETCDCAGREKLQDLGTLYYKAGGYHNCWYLSRKVSEEHGGYTQVTCPLCDRRLP